jgi:beta-lactamase superfamily II metal-dependent hydrolase
MAPQKPIQPAMQPPESGVTVRMYNPGFGDCFLLAFPAKDDSARYMLIDCGVHHKYPRGKERMQLIAADIAKATGNHLHVVVATHEHTDHLSGFQYGKEIFDAIEIDDLWLAWTEDPADPVAKHLKQIYGLRLRALTAAVNQLTFKNAPLAEALQGLLEFEFSDALTSKAVDRVSPLEYLRSKAKNKLQRSEDYRRPGEEPLTIPGVEGLTIYVLGPPKDEEFIKKLQIESELYPEITNVVEAGAFTAAALVTTRADLRNDNDAQLFRRSCPFDESLEIARDSASSHPKYGEFFRKYYGGFSDSSTHGQNWRRIDTDWLGTAEQLALAINARTNNTSLVLAMEMTESEPHKVLLFAADAQTGNWLSWEKLSWPGEGTGQGEVTVADLLRRTVLYKVGHHGSRNATLRQQGLEMMVSSNLVAMIPVDQRWANEEMHWDHPAEKLLGRLKDRTRGRVIRTDQIPSGDEMPAKPNDAFDRDWKSFIAQLDWDRSPDRLWVQYTVSG